MGVAGLWEVLRPAGQVRSLTELSVEDGFNANPSDQRGFRIGIDASIWFFHAAYGREGENPELRTLFFRCCRLLQSPLLPLFIFDGPNRPAVKRGKSVGGNAHWLTQGMKNIIDAFGFEWRVAPGEAEAELAYLNRIGIIDAVLSDDVDNFLFGATMVIRNPSNTLSGNRAHPVKNTQGKDDGNHVVTYTAEAILSNPSVGLSRPGTILIGLLSGGDYIPAGLPGCGQKFAAGLARAGFGDSLVRAIRELKGARLDAFLDQWRQDIRNELRTNKRGLLPSKKPSLAASLPDDFPSLPVLMSYADPVTSENTQRSNRKTPPILWKNDPDPMRIASLCELYFEWGVKDVIVHRFRTVLWPGVVCRAVRSAVVNEGRNRLQPWIGVCHSGDNDDSDDTAGPSLLMKRPTSTLSFRALPSPSKKSFPQPSDPTASESFILSSLVPLTSPASGVSSRSASTCPSTLPSSPLLLEVLSQRTHASTDSTLEYRVLVDPAPLVERAESGVKGLRPPLVGGLFGVDPEEEDGGTLDADESRSDDDGGKIERLETAAAVASRQGVKKRKARREVPTKPLRLWLPACMIRAAAPMLAEAYEEKVRAREEKKAKRGTKDVRGRYARTGASRPTGGDDADDSEPACGPPILKTGPKTKTKTTRISRGDRRRKPKHASEAQDDAYELIDLSAGESPCSSDTEGAGGNTEGKVKQKARTGRTEPTKPTKPTIKADATNKERINTMKEHFNTTKSPTMKVTKSKSSTFELTAVKAPSLNPTSSRRAYEEDYVDAIVPPPLPKSSRPLDLLRAKRKPSSVAANPTSKSKSQAKPPIVPRYEEEESSPSSPPRPSAFKPHASTFPHLLAQPAPQTRKKKPLFVDVSDTDSDIEVSGVRQPLSATTAIIPVNNEVEDKFFVVDGNVRASVSIGNTLAIESAKTGGVVDTIGLAAEGSRLKPKNDPSTSMIYSASSVQSPSKLAHILLSRLALKSNGESDGSEGDELPSFYHGSTKSKTRTTSTVTQSVPQPFPMQLAFESPASPRASKLRERGGRHEASDDVVEIVDVFTTPRGPSPLRSPTPGSSPDQCPPVHTSAGPFTSMQSNGCSASPTEPKAKINAGARKGTKQYRHTSNRATSVSGNEDGIVKSPRKSEVHSSPRHVDCVRRASSPTPSARPNQIGDTVGRKPHRSDTSAIYISSGSEDEGNTELGVGYAEEDERANEDADTWADTAMILSAPPSPVPPANDDQPAASTSEVALPNSARASKFKPAPAPVSKAGGPRPAPGEHRISAEITSKDLRYGEEDARTVRHAPLLVARSRRSKGIQGDIIDLTSD